MVMTNPWYWWPDVWWVVTNPWYWWAALWWLTHDIGDRHHHRNEDQEGAGEVHQEGEGDQEHYPKHQQHIPESKSNTSKTKAYLFTFIPLFHLYISIHLYIYIPIYINLYLHHHNVYLYHQMYNVHFYHLLFIV